MPYRHIGPGIATLFILLLTLSCGGNDNAASSATPGDPTCAPPASGATVSAGSCWTMIKPLGSGGFPAEAGSNDRPLWEPGKIPVTMQPFVAFNGDLWMSSRTSSSSSPTGLDWTKPGTSDTCS